VEYFFSSAPPARTRTGCAIAGVFEGGELSDSARNLNAASGRRIATAVSAGDIRGKLGETLLLSRLPGLSGERVLLVGLGTRANLDLKRYRRATTEAALVLKRIGARDAITYLSLEAVAGVDARTLARHAVEVLEQALYRFTAMKTGEDRPVALTRFGIAGEKSARGELEAGVREGEAIAAGVRLTRDLGNMPANVCTPSYLAKSARGLARSHRRISVEVLDAAQMKKLGMNALLAVGHASAEPPRLIVLQYLGAPERQAPVALVGKGITFDSGGICIKPSTDLDEMKYDMCGAASVLGVLEAAARLELPLDLVGVMPVAENMPDGSATRPGDIVKSMSGKTVEILNTDAEGRLILCDSLTYVRRYRPQLVIDIATLTGACVIALGGVYSGLMSGDETLVGEIRRASERACDPAWPLPLAEEYGEQLKSPFADFANIGGRPGGAITAACFLAKFTEGLRWAHLDIAGTAWLSGANKGATGRPVPLLVQLLLDRLREESAD
jgi:leucyl aminopeptidase